MSTFADLINPEATAKLQKIIDDHKAREKAEWEEWMRREEEHVKKTHFKTSEDMINWVMSGGRIVNGRDEMKLSEDGKCIMHYGQHSDEYDACFWYQWTEKTIEDWKAWVYQISQPEYLDFGYLPVWERWDENGRVLNKIEINETN